MDIALGGNVKDGANERQNERDRSVQDLWLEAQDVRWKVGAEGDHGGFCSLHQEQGILWVDDFRLNYL